MLKMQAKTVLNSGIVVMFFAKDVVVIEKQKKSLVLSQEEIDELVYLLQNRHKVVDTIARRPKPTPPPFPIVDGVVVEGANGSAAVVDLAGELQRMAIRNAELIQQLGELEDLLASMRGE